MASHTSLQINYKPFEEISALLNERIAAGDFPSAVYAVAEGGKIIFADALGDAVRASENTETHPATIETIYDLASLTKPLVTGLLCAILIERGKIDFDAPVVKYLEEFRRADKCALTIRQLLTHTSGFPSWLPLYILTGEQQGRTLDVIASLSLEYAPNTKVVYSDINFVTLGFLLERVSNLKLDELARHEIFRPLDLRNTFFNPPARALSRIAASESNGNAHERATYEETDPTSKFQNWRRNLIRGAVHDGNAYFLGGVAGHAGLFSNAFETVELARQFVASRTKLLRARTCQLFHTNMTEHLNEARSFAWQLAATPESTAGRALSPDSFGHLGFTGTSCWIDASREHRERIFVLLTNRTHAHALPFININGVRRRFHTLASDALDK
ncbi:MAG: serine hydrolase domain-containing protein [Pyrinomonadaceae bacterium]